jgi:hypothetical protein
LEFLPWTLLWPLVWLMGRRRVFAPGATPEGASAWRLLLVWVGVFLVFFSLSAGKRGLYLLPAFPAAALLCGAALDQALKGRGRLPRGWARGLAVGGLLLAGGGGALALSDGFTLRPGSGFALPPSFGVALVGVAAFAALAWSAAGRVRPVAAASAQTAVAVAALLGIELAVFSLVYPAMDGEKSPRHIAVAARRIAGPELAVGVFDHRPLIGGIAYYAGPPVVELPDPTTARRYLDDGGRAIILKRRHLERLAELGPLAIQASSRSGRRQLVVVAPAVAQGGSSESGSLE